MPNLKRFDYRLYQKRGFQKLIPAPINSSARLLTTLMAIWVLAACATTPLPPQNPTPAPQQQPQPDQNSSDKDGNDDKSDQGSGTDNAPEDKDDKNEANNEARNNIGHDGRYFNNRPGLTPPHMAGRDTKRLALLLPFSARSNRLKAEAASMLRAAELAVFEREDADILLIALDTKGTRAGTKTATKAAIASGADIILGPVIANNVQTAAQEAAKAELPLLAFSNDQSIAGGGTYLLSFPPEAEVERVVAYMASTGTQRFAIMGPDSAYGRRVAEAYNRAVAIYGGEVTARERYKGSDISVMQEPAQRLAAFHAQGEQRARANGGVTPLSYEAILLPEGGTALRSLAPLFPYYEVDPADVQFMGTGRWNDAQTAKEPALNRGIFAGPDKDARQPFLDSYDRAYGEDPTNLSSLAYDAVSFGAYIADGDPKLRRARAEHPDGFYGVDGHIRFNSDGRPDRALTIYKINYGDFTVLDPAPRAPPSAGLSGS